MDSILDYAANARLNNLWSFQTSPLDSINALVEEISQLNTNIAMLNLRVQQAAIGPQMPYMLQQSYIPQAFENTQYLNALHNSTLLHDGKEDTEGLSATETISSMSEMAESSLKMAKTFGKLTPEMDKTLQGIEGFNNMFKLVKGFTTLSEGGSVLEGVSSATEGAIGLADAGTIMTAAADLAPETLGISLAVGALLTSNILDRTKKEKKPAPDFSVFKYMADDSEAFSKLTAPYDLAVKNEYYDVKIQEFMEGLNKQGQKIFYDATSARLYPIAYNTAFSNVLEDAIIAHQPKTALFDTYEDRKGFKSIADPEDAFNLQPSNYDAAVIDKLSVNTSQKAYELMANLDVSKTIADVKHLQKIADQHGKKYVQDLFIEDSTYQLYDKFSPQKWWQYHKQEMDMQSAAEKVRSANRLYSVPLQTDNANTQQSIPVNFKKVPIAYYDNKEIDTGRKIVININKPLCEINTMNVKEAKEGVQDIKRMVSEAFLEILYSANAAH